MMHHLLDGSAEMQIINGAPWTDAQHAQGVNVREWLPQHLADRARESDADVRPWL